MSKQEINKYFIPVEVIKRQRYGWLDVKTYEYKLFSDASEKKFTHIKLIDINGFVVGEHMPTKLHTIYDKATAQVKTNTVKAAAEIRQVVGEVKNIAVNTAVDLSQDVSKTAKQTATIAVGLFGRLKSYAQEKVKSNKLEPRITVVNMEQSINNDEKKNFNTNDQ